MQQSDEVWHAGDIGKTELLDEIEALKPLKAVFGNIDNFEIREKFQEDLNFHCEGLKIYITHIGGYPGNYNKRVKKVIEETRPNVFICGHSHILKVIYDKKNDLLHMNPGSCGLQGFHKKRTMLKFNIENKKITNLNVIELGGK